MVANLNISKITNVTYISDEYAQINGELFSYVCQSILSRPSPNSYNLYISHTLSVPLVHYQYDSSSLQHSSTFRFLANSPSLSSILHIYPDHFQFLLSTPRLSLPVSVSIVHSPFVSFSLRLYRPLPICLFLSPSLSSTPR